MGRHVVRALAVAGHEAFGLVRTPGSLGDVPATEVVADLTDAEATKKAFQEVRPEGVFHLAAPETSVGHSWKDPEGTKQGNLTTLRTVLEAAATLENPPRLVFASSAEVYGATKPEEQPLDEASPQRPDSPYAESKQAGEALVREYADRMPVIIARPFNHVGPGQRDQFALASFAKQIAEIERQGGSLKHGNLEARRDFSDVRDVVRAYLLLMERGVPGEAYNIGSGTARSIQDLLDMLVAESPAKIEVVVDKARFRPNEVPIMQCDAGKIRALGWEPRIPIEQTMKDILDDARKRLDND